MCLWAAFFLLFMASIKNKYNILFYGFILSIGASLFYFRPLSSTWFPIIGGDGLGYYSYLPARYIYHDNNYEFKWFNKVYNDNYPFCSFDSPEDNFMVQYKDKRINKYYPGLSLLWTPFFVIAHGSAKLSGYKADGYSLPYQIAIAFASLCYLFLGLFYLRKLIQKLYHNELLSLIIPFTIFYGTHLFYYTVFLNSQSHTYSFTFVTLFLYFTYSFFNEADKKTFHLILSVLCFSILISIRPLNGLIVFAIPALIPNNFFKEKYKIKLESKSILPLVLVLLVIINTCVILYTQTETVIPYTYVNERFYFTNPKLFDVLFSYHAGLFTYVPLALISFFGVFYLKNKVQKFLFPAILFLILYLYSSWWYWPITTRALIDFYPIIALILAALLSKVINYPKLKTTFITLLFILTGYHQLKSFQLHNGILDENYTHSELYWQNFFRIHKTNLFTIPPTSIVEQNSFLENFETNTYVGLKSNQLSRTGSFSGLLDKDHPFSSIFRYNLPNFFTNQGIKKIRFSGWFYFNPEIKNAQVIFQFFNRKDSLLFETPYYISSDVIQYEKWDYKEFGCELSAEELNSKTIDHIQIFVWNDEAKGKLHIDDIKTEFILTDKSFEIVQ
jgi:hypothetical protein